VNDRELDRILKQSAAAPPPVDPALLARLSASLGASLAAVKPLPASWILIAALAALWAAIAVTSAALLGFAGIRRLTGPEAAVIFTVLAILAVLSSAVCVAQTIPGSRHWLPPVLLLDAACSVLVCLFALMFRDYTTTRFLYFGSKCLVAGLAVALPAGWLTWLILRRGYTVDRTAAGLAAGTLAGLAGLAMLELHCPISETYHILLWHIAVLPLAAAAGAALARIKGRHALPPESHAP
jgi:hypothetical protein